MYCHFAPKWQVLVLSILYLNFYNALTVEILECSLSKFFIHKRIISPILLIQSFIKIFIKLWKKMESTVFNQIGSFSQRNEMFLINQLHAIRVRIIRVYLGADICKITRSWVSGWNNSFHMSITIMLVELWGF